MPEKQINCETRRRARRRQSGRRVAWG